MPDNNLLIREATTHDLVSLRDLLSELGYPATYENVSERYRLIFKDPDYKTFVAEYLGEIVGMSGAFTCYYFEQNGCYVRLAALVTRQSHRHKGIGKALVNAVEQWAREVNASAILLNCGNRPERQVAHAFYVKVGFQAKSTGYIKRISNT